MYAASVLAGIRFRSSSNRRSVKLFEVQMLQRIFGINDTKIKLKKEQTEGTRPFLSKFNFPIYWAEQ